MFVTMDVLADVKTDVITSYLCMGSRSQTFVAESTTWVHGLNKARAKGPW
jgi:hypothetical protein